MAKKQPRKIPKLGPKERASSTPSLFSDYAWIVEPETTSHRASASQRGGAKKRGIKVRVNEETHRALNTLSENHGLTHDGAIRQLIEFYYMQHLDLLTRHIRMMYDRGLTSIEINQLSVLYTLLQHIDDRVGLT